MTAEGTSVRCRSQSGVTLVETLAVLAISSMIMIPLLGWAVLALQEQEAAYNRNTDGASIGLLRTYFVRDVASANGAATGAAAEGTDCSGGDGAATAPAQTLLRLEGDDGESVVYNEVTSSGGSGLSLWRRECDGTTLTSTTEVVDRLASGGTAVTCSARAGAPETDCGRVNLRLVTVDAETVSMTATVRAGEVVGGPSGGGPVYVSPDVIIAVTPTTVFRGDTVTFDVSASSNPGGGTLTHHWDFDDGTTSTNAVATRSYDTLGEYTALYTATNEDGTPASEFVRITVENEPPTAVISAPPGGFATTRCADVSFAAAGSNDSGDTVYGGNVVEYRWSYDDGETSTRTSPAGHTHQFGTLGPSGGTAPLDVVLVVIDNEDGGSLAATRPVLVRNRPPGTPSITADGATGTIAAVPTVPVEFAATASDPDMCDTSDEVLTYGWDFGDGETATCTGPSCEATTHAYTTTGTFTAVLTVFDTGGAAVTSNEIIVDLETSPVASFTMAATTARAGIPLPAGWITNTSADPDGGPLTAAWTFQNGMPASSSALDPPSVTFTHDVGDEDTFVSADYTVGLTVTDSRGVPHFTDRTITVTGAPAPGRFRTTTSGCLNPASCNDGRFISFAWDAVPDSSQFQIDVECTTPACTENIPPQTISGSATSYVFGGLAGGPSPRTYDARIRTRDSVTGKWGAWSDPPIGVSS